MKGEENPTKSPKANPWWKSPAWVSAVAAFIAVAIPGAVAVHGMFDMWMNSNQHLHEIRLQYLDRALDPKRDAEYRESVLKFLVSTFDDDDAMRTWAQEQLNSIQEVLQLRRKLANTTNELSKTLRREEALTSHIENLTKEISVLQKGLERAESRAGVSPRWASLTIINTVVNDNGGSQAASDFILTVNGSVVESGITSEFLPGRYVVDQLEIPGYANSSWSGDCAEDGVVLLVAGQHKICRIVNNDEAG